MPLFYFVIHISNFFIVDTPTYEEPNRRVLTVDAVEKPWGLDYLRFGLGLSSDFSGDAYFNVLASYRQIWINKVGAEWRNNFQVGRSSSIAGLYLGSQFTRFGELRLGAVFGTVRPTLDTGPEILSPGESRIEQGAYTLRLIFDQLDSAFFPRSGWAVRAKVFNSNESLGAEAPYTKWDADGFAAVSSGNHTYNLGGKAGGTIGNNPLPRYDLFQWGGFLQQSGYATG